MPRELNPELFGVINASQEPRSAQFNSDFEFGGPLGANSGLSMMAGAGTALAAQPSDTVDNLKKKVRELENQVESLHHKMEKMALNFEQKLTQVQSLSKNIDSNMKSSLTEIHQQQAQMSSKINERRVTDNKIQDLVERHNQLVQNFEVRLLNMHKVSSEQEMKIMTYQATIDEILREIKRRP